MFQIRHQLRVATRHHEHGSIPPSNICLDVAVIVDSDLDQFSTNDFVPNGSLVTFGEAKHMSAFAELVAAFVGLVHEMQPERLGRARLPTFTPAPHPAPFLFVSGYFWRTAEGLVKTLADRQMDIDVRNRDNPLSPTIRLP
ncbi:MAG: hypothetical protein LAQ69_07145 [Acidobacteriia bacterium]|nr:hypothetical protein [Terriglobia bacterium]